MTIGNMGNAKNMTFKFKLKNAKRVAVSNVIQHIYCKLYILKTEIPRIHT